jgi:hypothetical protein
LDSTKSWSDDDLIFDSRIKKGKVLFFSSQSKDKEKQKISVKLLVSIQIAEMRPGLLASGRHSLPLVSVQQSRFWRSFLSRLVVGKSSSLILSVIMLAHVPITRVPKRITTGRSINFLTSFAQPTK